MPGSKTRLIVLSAVAGVLVIVFVVYLFWGDGVGYYAAILESSSDSAARQEAIRELEAIRSDAASDVVVQYLADEQTPVACTAIEALGRMNRTDLAPKIEAALDDDRPEVQAAAFSALLYYNEHAQQAARRAASIVNDRRQPIQLRARAAEFLGRHGDPRYVPALIHAMKTGPESLYYKSLGSVEQIFELVFRFDQHNKLDHRGNVIRRVEAHWHMVKGKVAS